MDQDRQLFIQLIAQSINNVPLTSAIMFNSPSVIKQAISSIVSFSTSRPDNAQMPCRCQICEKVYIITCTIPVILVVEVHSKCIHTAVHREMVVQSCMIKEDNEIKEVACTLDPLILHVQLVVLLVVL